MALERHLSTHARTSGAVGSSTSLLPQSAANHLPPSLAKNKFQPLQQQLPTCNRFDCQHTLFLTEQA
eukprot:2476576-Amphidinium_carterae.1